MQKINSGYGALVGDEGKELFVSRKWTGIVDGEERRIVLERVVLGSEESIRRREMRRWKGRVEVGAGGRDRWGRWRLSGNERRRRVRVAREAGGVRMEKAGSGVGASGVGRWE